MGQDKKRIKELEKALGDLVDSVGLIAFKAGAKTHISEKEWVDNDQVIIAARDALKNTEYKAKTVDELLRRTCSCECHIPGSHVMHFMPCC